MNNLIKKILFVNLKKPYVDLSKHLECGMRGLMGFKRKRVSNSVDMIKHLSFDGWNKNKLFTWFYT